MGEYPTIETFPYLETITFDHVGKPYLSYVQRTTHPDGSPTHGELGFWRLPAPSSVELVAIHPFGATEMAVGSLSGTTIDLQSLSVVSTPAAKTVTGIERTITVDGDVLRYTVRMAAVGSTDDAPPLGRAPPRLIRDGARRRHHLVARDARPGRA